ncbi:1,4-dihydroxy-2-naphthoate polyprenyltransferase [Luteipulveratus mongoliensis]|uniref:1,4-dihydroxy-2-naphthoate octaprenyltransferase n=1 Tax=Luteipulveratus mongoliensis TaxID=571913 RepID=A0A0K1JN20_9MICO|nr:1,4-dihydroxy-2-naphthoate polyprenyltransferase [Luteipulveratus mongoliensis]AKU17983.1 1,4-dihydroxy-2-naphthoate prenyltransferase [Luteipulveratus mongoliensis]
MATLQEWVQGARPRTLPAAVAPVLVGTGAAYALEEANPGYALLALLVSVALQVGVNYANDYSDGIRGTDDVRVGPVRLVGQRLAQPSNVKMAAFIAFGVAALTGLTLITLANTPWFLLIGALAIVAAWKYTGGKKPYGYLGLGELFVFIFFGLVAVLGTTFTQAKELDAAAWAGACGVGAVACAVLVVNNLRDIPGDTESGKRTLAVRIGDPATRTLYAVLIVAALACVIVASLSHTWALLGLVSGVLAVPPLRTVLSGRKGRDLIPALAGTGLFLLAYGVLLGLGLYLAHRVG